ncbi:phosphoenolpyruvate--protein phosphotransferase [Beggiatoa leptomitoformis]|uniref:Phosphoenolpyruvate-protein phosphotransferase n=1 Tax=Beggiatoa leptomitoformis TaxID=288004 RepID=A0A2N9YI62_9GAMM|nr:phosphoenolpyruvate--protein phosphotransferase [Beggiatoa leptomitoformis]ALG67556.1 phosphoenolpyruvate--protein phosphotransferase [Beggiatoa leptomitoformis]AUI70218.1 phosphoenolpyruvate--protein phosphotransferase [Beggiatoa leptomitoformis]
MSLTLHGIGVSKGIAIGKVHIINRDHIEVGEYTLSVQSLEEEVSRFEGAVDVAREQLQKIRQYVSKHTATDVAAFIDTHLLMLEDAVFIESPIRLIRERQCNAEWALKLHHDYLIQVFDEMDDPYLKSRKDDVAQVINRIQRVLRGYPDLAEDLSTESLAQAIVLSDDLSPADTALMQHRGVVAFATESGGTTSHTAILARSLGIPAIVGLRRARAYIQHGETLIIDGIHGMLIADPDERALRYYRNRQRDEKRYRASLGKLKNAPTMTKDGTPILLQANIEFPEDMTAVRRVGGEGVGLYRTEFLYMNRPTPPTEEEHFDAYLRVLQAAKSAPVTIRTLDLGADKQVRYQEISTATNPALGLRAIRLCLKDLKMFKTQLRAIIRASAFGQVRMMIPMISGIQELLQVRGLVNEVQNELAHKAVRFDQAMQIGAMVEVPAVAACIDLYAPYSDFFSIGTNDLIQYTLAIDRVDDSVNYLYDPLHPAVLRLIKMSIDAAHKSERSISMCGEMASDSRYVRLLLGLGLRSFSVNPESLLEIKQIIINSDMTGLSRSANKLLRLTAHVDIVELLEYINR